MMICKFLKQFTSTKQLLDQRLYISRLLKDDIYLFYLDSTNWVIPYEFCTLCALLPSENPAKEKNFTAISSSPGGIDIRRPSV